MAKQVKKIKSGNDLITLIISDKKIRKDVLHAIEKEGPAHKQAYSDLLLSNMYTLLKLIEKTTGKKFEVQRGSLLTSHKDEWEVPIPLPSAAVKKHNVKKLSHSPAHEIAAFNALLQAISWGIKSMK